MEKTTRTKAKELGLLTYFTGKPCKYGHRDERYTSYGKCVQCAEMTLEEKRGYRTKPRICKCCGKEFLVGTGGLRSDATHCSKRCTHLMANKEYRKNNPAKMQEKKLRQLYDLPRRMAARAKKRAKKKGLDFTITYADIVVPEHCPILGTKMFWNHTINGRKAQRTTPSLDRIDSSKGYTPDNIQVISYRANCLKSNATIEELEAVLNHLKRIAECV